MTGIFTYLYKGKRSLLSYPLICRNTINFTGRFLERQRASASIPLQVYTALSERENTSHWHPGTYYKLSMQTQTACAPIGGHVHPGPDCESDCICCTAYPVTGLPCSGHRLPNSQNTGTTMFPIGMNVWS